MNRLIIHSCCLLAILFVWLVGRHAYLGLEFDDMQTWTWNDNAPLQFSNWEVSPNTSSLVSPLIAVISGRHKTWTPLEESGASAHVICQMIRELFSVCVCVACVMFCYHCCVHCDHYFYYHQHQHQHGHQHKHQQYLEIILLLLLLLFLLLLLLLLLTMLLPPTPTQPTTPRLLLLLQLQPLLQLLLLLL